ncbi:hypothetical protein NUH30_18890 [Leptospira sp. 85282-16]|uniref:hypothetical protein n=1 Tax=Leptospira sp. 85282-16 TaxID=2971256 RepID=UPI0021C0E9F1|nr:hypothetical protein [Leptospira sp. 85282-16]MCT8335760.1 hypothetical protein [Leptospira sp. 85282-16]
MLANIDQKINQAQGEASKELVVTSIEKSSLSVKIGSKPFYVRESDTGRKFYWNGLKFIDLTNDPGLRACNTLRIATNVADAEAVVIGSRSYEFDRAENGVVSGNIAVKGHADDTPGNAITALVEAINSDAISEVTAIKVSANEMFVYHKEPGNKTTATSETLMGANNGWASATLLNGREPGSQSYSVIRRVPTAVEVALGVMHFYFDYPPTLADIRVVVTATPGVPLAWDGAVTITGNRFTIDNNGSVDWSTTNTIVLTVAK